MAIMPQVFSSGSFIKCRGVNIVLLLLVIFRHSVQSQTSTCSSSVGEARNLKSLDHDLWSSSVKDEMVGSVILQDVDSSSMYGVTTMWVYLDEMSEHVRPILSVHSVNNQQQQKPRLKIVVSSSRILAFVQQESSAPSLSSGMIPENQWAHVGFSWVIEQRDDTGGSSSTFTTKLALHVNGQVVSMVHKSGALKFGANSQWVVGGDEEEHLRLSHWALWYQSLPAPHAYWEGYEASLIQASFATGSSKKKLLSLYPSHLYLVDALPSSEDDDDVQWSWEMVDATNRIHGLVQRRDLFELSFFRTIKHYRRYRDGIYKPNVSLDMLQHSDTVARHRRQYMKRAMQHVWSGYQEHAWGQDEMYPVSGEGHDNWGGIGTTLVDSLSTLWLLNMTDEFNEAKEWVTNELTFDHVGEVSVFETTIRHLGGLLSAYDLTQEKVFLEKAQDLGQRLLRAFDSPSGVPFGRTILNATHGHGSSNTDWHRNSAALAELGTLQVEFRYLSRVTGNPEYEEKAMRVFELMEPLQPSEGLYPIFVDNLNASPTLRRSQVSMGAMGDSFYEYLLKVWLQGGRRENNYRDMYDRAMDGFHRNIVHKSSPNRLTYIAEMDKNEALVPKMDHLACFMGGNLALGAYTHPDGLDSRNAQRDLRVGKALAYTCYQMYAQSKTGMAPEMVRFQPGTSDFVVTKSGTHNLLRPETVETFFILHFLTKDPVYREWGWEIFLALEEYSRTSIGYASLRNVNDHNHGHEDKMESFFLAETLKYLYLLQDPDMQLDILNKHVFNTEAHPLRMFDRLG